MPRGAPDYSNVRASEPLHRLDDMAELAARLDSPVKFDREGRVIHLDDFSEGIPQWGSATYGTGGAVVLSSERALSPPFAIKLTTGNDGAAGAKIEMQVPYHHECKMGLEYAFTHDTNGLYHYCQFFHWNGTTKYHYVVRYYIQDGVIKVKDSSGDFQTFAENVGLKGDAWLFYQNKLVVDTENNRYVRFTLNNETYDLSDYEPYSESQATIPYLEVVMSFYGPAGSNIDHYVDNVVITQNEP